MKKMLSSKEKRKEHNVKSSDVMKRIRKRKGYVEKEHVRRKKQKLGFSFTEAVEKFNEAICSCSYVCSCCHQVWFKQSVKEVDSLKKSVSFDRFLLQKCTTGYISVANREWICNTCLFNIKQGKIPKLSVINGMTFPTETT